MKSIEEMTDLELQIALSSQLLENVTLDPSDPDYDHKMNLVLETDGITKVKEFEKKQLIS